MKRLSLGPVLLCAVLAGCGGKFQTVGVSPFTGTHSAFSEASVQITDGTAGTDSTEVGTVVIALLNEKMRRQLADQSLKFTETSGDGLQIEVRITSLRQVSMMKRILLSVFAGRAKIVAEVSFTANGQVLGKYTVSGTSHGSMGSGLSETEVALDKFTKGVGTLVTELQSGGSS